MKYILFAAAFAFIATASVPAHADARVGVQIVIGNAPPPPRYEVVPRPRRDHVWVPGYWNWTGRKHVWIGGHWQTVRAGHHYRRSEWRQSRHGWYLDRGGWQRHQHRAHENVHRRHSGRARHDHWHAHRHNQRHH